MPILAAAGLLVSPIAAQDGQKFRVSTNTVALYATVTDADGRLVPDLIREDFEVYDNGKLQTLTSFDNKPLPVTVIVMLDSSGSMTLSLDLVKSGAEQFLIRMLPEDVGMVGAFNDKIEFHPDHFTSNRDELVGLLKELDFGYPTRLYDAINQSMAQLKGIKERKVVLVFTDGDDSASKVGAGEVTNRARDEDVMIYSIGLENTYFNGQQRVRSSPDRGLKKLSEETGGGFFLLKKTDDLGSTFTRVAQEIHSQYVLGFTPQVMDGKVHKLEVKLKKPSMAARARKSYVAGSEGTTNK
ncbi:MAG: VWA domain-containing protein [Acidobacteria bacterium]|nr:VWA domain-containing protein [Acidobacteriota bacterium]